MKDTKGYRPYRRREGDPECSCGRRCRITWWEEEFIRHAALGRSGSYSFRLIREAEDKAAEEENRAPQRLSEQYIWHIKATHSLVQHHIDTARTHVATALLDDLLDDVRENRGSPPTFKDRMDLITRLDASILPPTKKEVDQTSNMKLDISVDLNADNENTVGDGDSDGGK